MRFLITSKALFELSIFSRQLLKAGNSVIFSQNNDEIADFLTNGKIDALISDEKGTDELKALVRRFPLLNIALLSDKKTDDFHEATEGLGIFAQIPTLPEKNHAEEFIEKLKKIQCITAK